MAARQISQLFERCKGAPRSISDSTRCGIAAYMGYAPDFDISGEIDGRPGAAASEAPVSGLRISTERSAVTDDQLQA
jgi:hypothetical protein